MTSAGHATLHHPSACDRLCRWLNTHCGIYYPEAKRDLITQRLNRVLDRFQLSGLEELADHVDNGEPRDLVLAVMHAASTNHTYFFREPEVLDFFRQTILPAFSQRNTIRIWSAAASTGDEAYTIAIIAAELWGREQARRRVAILGTDISEPVIAHAEKGVYGSVHLDHTSDDIVRRYFKECGDQLYSISDEIRTICTFRRLNLRAIPYPFKGQFDIVFCRNVLYYFDREHQRLVLDAIYDVTEPGGWLLTSVTEAVRDLGTRWTPVAGGIHRRLA
jgi:chemotaxis protein methyltransferase CheR